MSLPPVGCQLIVFRPQYDINKDTDLILDSLAKAGYAAVEGGPQDPVMYKEKLQQRGLRYAGSHTGLGGLADLDPIIRYLKTLGASDLCNSGLRTWNDRTKEDYLEAIQVLNDAGRRLRDEGIQLHYHNHDFEFEKVDGDKRGIDLLAEGLDPDAADLCVDVAWVMRGGDDPASFLKAHKDRIDYLHFKDHDGQDWAELGRGQVDFQSIMEVLPTLDRVRWVVVEQDTAKLDPTESVAVSRRYLRETFGY